MTEIDAKGRVSRLLDEFDSKSALCQQYTEHLVAELGEALFNSGIKCHSIDGRLKSRESFLGKVTAGKRVYDSLDEITDVSGVRVTTYFARDVDRIAAVISPLYEIDTRNSIDRRATIDSDRFGYLSIHFIVSPKTRSKDANRSKFIGMKAEIQVRSILQHAWAEMEHDLGYKFPGGVPRHIRRKFSSAASLLEIADEKFDEIRDEITGYILHLPQSIASAETTVKLDIHSLAHLVKSHLAIREVDTGIATLVSATISGDISIARLLRMLELVQIDTVQALFETLRENKSLLVAFASEWFSRSFAGKVIAINRGTALLFLFYALISRGLDASKVIGLLHKSGVSDRLVSETSNRILEVASAIDASASADLL